MERANTTELKLGFTLAWCGAARFADLKVLRAKRFTWIPDGSVAVDWSGTKFDPFVRGTTTLVYLPDWAKGALRDTLARLSRTTPYSTFPVSFGSSVCNQ